MIKRKQYFLTLVLLCQFFRPGISQEFDGIWLAEGYGEILDISGAKANWYQVTGISNIFDETLRIKNNKLGMGEDLIGKLSIQGRNRLRLKLAGGTKRYFNLIGELPPVTLPSDNPRLNFDVFWQTFQDWCALFPILDIDWNAEYRRYSALITPATTDDELFAYMTALLGQLNDGHSYLDDGNGREWYGGPMVGELWYDLEEEMIDLIEEKYIDGKRYRYSGRKQIAYGIIEEDIGYIAVNSMDDYEPNGNELDDNEAFTEAIEKAIKFVKRTAGLIIDIRFNYGGYDSNSRILANRLTRDSIPVYAKQARWGKYDEFTEPQYFAIQPEGKAFVNKPVVVLTSGGTQSAAEVFAMVAKAIDCVTVIGENTYGIFSDSYVKYLPNEWEFGISPERYTDMDGVDYEQRGIPPDVPVTGKKSTFKRGKDNILEFALGEVQNSCADVSSSTSGPEERVFEILPNPAQERILVLGPPNEMLEVRLVNISGILMPPDINVGKDHLELNISSLPNGMYILQIRTEMRTENLRFLKN